MAWYRLRFLLRRWLRRGSVETHLDAEVESYLQHQIDAFVASGIPEDQARRRALMELGGREQVKERVRSARTGVWLESLAGDLVQAVRIHARHPGFFAVAVLTLGAGIAAATTTFSVLDTVLLRPLPYRDPDRLVSVWVSFPEWRTDPTLSLIADEMSVARGAYGQWLETQTVFESAGMYASFGDAIVEGLETPVQARIGYATPNLFSVLGVQAELGRVFDPAGGREESASVLLGRATWRRVFGGDPGAIGRSITLDLDGLRSPLTVIGVLPADFELRSEDNDPDPPPEIWLSTEHPAAPEEGEVIARMKPGISIDQAQEETARLFSGISYEGSLPAWMPGTDSPTARVVSRHAEETDHTRATLFVLFGCAGLFLVIAAGNVANLIVGRAVERENEIAMRSALGAGRWRILRQLGVESLLLVAAGGILGAILAGGGIQVAAGWLPSEFPRADQIRLDFRILVFAAGMCALAGMAFSLAPALAIRLDLERALRRTGRTTAGRNRLQRWIVVGEVAVSFALLIGAALLVQSLVRLTSVELGLGAENILAAEVATPPEYAFRISALEDLTPEELTRFLTDHRTRLRSFREQVERRLVALPGVTGVAAAVDGSPFSGSHTIGQFGTEREGPQASIPIEHRRVSADYFDVLDVPILAGRTFSSAEEEDVSLVPDQDVPGSRSAPAAIVNEAAAERFWPGEDPVGRTLWSGDQSRVVVGLAGNVREFGFAEDPTPTVYLPIGAGLGRLPTFLLETEAGSPALAGPVREAIWSVDAGVPITRLDSLEALLLQSYATERQRAWLTAAFALSAVGLGLVGLYGVIARAVTLRKREFSIRAALGARTGVLLRMVLGDGIRLTAAGIVLGGAVSLAGARLLSGLLYGIDAVDAPTYLVAALGVAFVALVASYLPARRAARSDPTDALRAE